MTAPSAGRCAVTATASPSSFGPDGGTGSVSIQTERDCTWSISANASWVSLGAGANGQGGAVVPYTVAANPAPTPRSAALSVGSQEVPVSQAPAPCTFKLSGVRDGIAASGGQLTVTVSTLSGCAWNASSSASWISISSGQRATGSAAVTMDVAANEGGPRVGVVNIAGQGYTVAQDGSTATPPPNPSPSPEISVGGQVMTVRGRCPSLTFTIPGATISTTRDTTFSGGNCDKVKTGRSVTAQGTLGAGGVIVADVVKLN